MTDRFSSPPNRRRGFWRLGLLLGFLGLALTTYLSLKSSPRMTTVAWLPVWLTRWADHWGQFRNFPAFGLISLPFLAMAATRRQRIWTVINLTLFLTILEVAQFLLPTRSPDAIDVLWGIAGMLTAGLAVELFRWRQAQHRTREITPTPDA